MSALSRIRGLRDLHLAPFTKDLLLSGAVVTSLAGALYWCIQDYRFYLSLGPGGPPYNLFGWAAVSFLVRPFTLSAKDTRWTGDYPDTGAHQDVLALPERKGARPQIGGVAPQRQLSQHPSDDIKKRESAILESAVAHNPDLLQMKMSHYERYHPAVYVHEVLLKSPSAKTTLHKDAIAAQGEHGHVHGDGSVHLYFSPADAKVIIEKGWAERHRLARQQPFYFGWKKYIYGVAPTYLMVYAPRDEAELEVLKVLMRNSIRFMTGREDIADF